MLKSQFDYLCENFGDPNMLVTERWRAIKYLFIKNPLMDVQFLIKHNEIIYSDNNSVGPGFFVLGTPNSDLEVINKGYVITYIPIESIEAITFVSTYVEDDNTNISQMSNMFNNDNPIVAGTSFNTDTNYFSSIIE